MRRKSVGQFFIVSIPARGRFAVERFKDAAERYGVIVVGSNNSRNGAGVPLESILQNFWNDTHARFAIDENRTYAAGPPRAAQALQARED